MSFSPAADLAIALWCCGIPFPPCFCLCAAIPSSGPVASGKAVNETLSPWASLETLERSRNILRLSHEVELVTCNTKNSSCPPQLYALDIVKNIRLVFCFFFFLCRGEKKQKKKPYLCTSSSWTACRYVSCTKQDIICIVLGLTAGRILPWIFEFIICQGATKDSMTFFSPHSITDSEEGP